MMEVNLEYLGDWYGSDAVAYRITAGLFPRLQSCLVDPGGLRITKWTTERWLVTRKRAKLTLTLMTLEGRKFINKEVTA